MQLSHAMQTRATARQSLGVKVLSMQPQRPPFMRRWPSWGLRSEQRLVHRSGVALAALSIGFLLQADAASLPMPPVQRADRHTATLFEPDSGAPHDVVDCAAAHYAEARRLARMGQHGAARAQLVLAERLVPTLSFAPPDELRDLRAELRAPPDARSIDPASRQSGWPTTLLWGVPIAIGGGALAAWLLMRLSRDRSAAPPGDNGRAWAPPSIVGGIENHAPSHRADGHHPQSDAQSTPHSGQHGRGD